MNTLLIVEDEKMIRQGIKAMALRSQVPINMIMECKNGLEALEILQNQEVDVVITDIRMPKMDGITLVKEIQRCNRVPMIIVISGYDDFSYAVELLRMGVKDYLLKPIERTQVTECLQKLDEELEKNKQKQHTMTNIGFQQLSRLMQSDDIDTSESNLIMGQFSSIFNDNEYIVCCTDYREENYEQEGTIFIRDNNKQGVFVIDNSQKDIILNSDLRGYYVGVSLVHKGLEEVREAYNEALIARKQAFVMQKLNVCYYECNINNQECQNIDEQEIEQMVQMLGTNKIDEVIKSFEHLCYQTKVGNIALSDFERSNRVLVYKTREMYRNAIDFSKDFISSDNDILFYHTINDYMKHLSQWLTDVNGKLLVQFDDYRNKQKIQQALLFINENYKNDLNMAVVSNHISMNYSLFSFAFKQYTGYNFVNYLKKIRIDEAKRLLRTTEMRIVDIGLAVGYENDKHFMKIFKSVCGVSPTEFRKNALINMN